MKRCILLLSFLLLCACRQHEAPVFSEPESLPAVQIDLSNSEPKIGEPIDLTLRVSAQERLVLPPVSEWLDPAVEILSSETKMIEEDPRWIQEQHLQLALFQVTNVVLFARTQIETLNDPPLELTLPFQNINVASVLPEEDPAPVFGDDTLPDFRGPEALKRQKRNLIISAVAGVLLLILAGVVTWILARRPKPVPPPVPPHRTALKEMEKLTQSEIWQRPDVDACAVALSLILRRYIEARFDIRAPEQTTEEFLEMAEARAPWPEQEHKGLTRFFAVTDQIKFAGSRPGSQVLEDLLTAARDFVESTRQTTGEAS